MDMVYETITPSYEAFFRLSEQPISRILTQMRAVQENLSEKQRLAGDGRYH